MGLERQLRIVLGDNRLNSPSVLMNITVFPFNFDVNRAIIVEVIVRLNAIVSIKLEIN
jgi:hypothetical protein